MWTTGRCGSELSVPGQTAERRKSSGLAVEAPAVLVVGGLPLPLGLVEDSLAGRMVSKLLASQLGSS